MPPSCPPALLALANGAVFYGDSVGASGSTVGEVVFNTALTGYQEILTDTSYARQIVTLTAPHIGNTGVNEEDIESSHIQAAGLVVRDMPAVPSNFRMRQTLAEYLRTQLIVAIAGIDTRRLTRMLRTQGAQNGCIVTGEDAVARVDQAIERAQKAAAMQGSELIHMVSTAAPYPWTQMEWRAGKGYGDSSALEHFSVRLPKERARRQYGDRCGRSRFRRAQRDGCDPAAIPNTENAEATQGKPLKNALAARRLRIRCLYAKARWRRVICKNALAHARSLRIFPWKSKAARLSDCWVRTAPAKPPPFI